MPLKRSKSRRDKRATEDDALSAISGCSDDASVVLPTDNPKRIIPARDLNVCVLDDDDPQHHAVSKELRRLKEKLPQPKAKRQASLFDVLSRVRPAGL